MSEVWLYESGRAQERCAIIHRANCRWCNSGTGVHGGDQAPGSGWHGPFGSVDEARSAAARHGTKTRVCAHCARIEPQEPRRHGRKASPAVVLMILASVFFLFGGLFFSWSEEASPPRPSFPNGGILVFTDVPHESVSIDFVVNTQGYFSISVSGGRGNFLVVASGSASVEPVHNTPNGQADFLSGILIHSVSGYYGTGEWKDGNFKAPHFLPTLGYGYQISGYVGNRNVMMAAGNQYDGVLQPGEKSLVFGRLRTPIVARSGPIELGQLPLIGTAPSMVTNGPERAFQGTMSPITISGQLSRLSRTMFLPAANDTIASSAKEWYTPKADVRISIVPSKDSVGNFDPSAIPPSLLPPSYRLDSAAPPTANSSELLWKSANAVQVTWDLTDLSAAQNASIWLFFSGLVIGAGASFLGIAIDRFLGPH